jgi:stage IV sporulation protein FB
VWSDTTKVTLSRDGNRVFLSSDSMLRIDTLTHVGRISRVDIYVHWSVFALAAFMLFGVLQRPITTLVGIACWMGVLLLHECGHMIAARARRSHVHAIELYPIYAVTRFETPWSRFDHAVIAWGGVIAQASIAIPMVLWIKFVGYTPFEAANEVLVLFGFFSLAIAIFNLLPLQPLDGAMAWQIVPAALERARNMPRRKSAGWRTYR